MEDVYAYFYIRYEEKYSHWCQVRDEWIVAMSVANHKQIDKILKTCRDDEEDEDLILHAMHSCVGCIGDSVPALED